MIFLIFSSEEETDIWKSIGYRCRKSFEVLGPSFIKLGQLLSTREDLFGEGFIEEMKFLQNKVEIIPFNIMKPIIEEEIGTKNIKLNFSRVVKVPKKEMLTLSKKSKEFGCAESYNINSQ